MSRVIYFIIALAFWVLLTLPLDREHLIAGVVVCGITAMAFGKTRIIQPRKFLQPLRYGWAVVYVVVLLWECIKANFDVAYRVLHPAMPIHPGIVKTRTSLKTDIARACLANSVTMTPGTISVDMDGEGEFYIHWINVRTQDEGRAKEIIFERFEKILRRVFE